MGRCYKIVQGCCCQMIFILMGVLLFVQPIHAQDSLTIKRLDDRHLAMPPGTVVVADPTAHRGSAMMRTSASGDNTFWFGPYGDFQAGNYLVQFRMKVSSNLSNARIISIDASSPIKGSLTGMIITPSMFRASGEWQLITFPLQLSENVTDLELRGIGFIGGICDLSLDYINLVPGDLRGFYSDEFAIDGKGNVSIGRISASGYKLAVAGRLIAESVKVQLQGTWPDYVFAKGYKLPSLDSVAAHIQHYGHLPGIPSAQEVKISGMDLGTINSKLLQKIEELTLYLMEKNSQVQKLEKRMSEMEKKINIKK